MATATTGVNLGNSTALEENRKSLTGNEMPSAATTTNNNAKGGSLDLATGGGEDTASSVEVPGKFGSYISYIVMIIGMVGAIICRRYSSFPLLGSIDEWTADCPDGYADACRANQAVLRFSFALVILFGVQLIGVAAYPKFYDSYWVFKFLAFVALIVGFFYARPEVFDNHGYAWFARIGGFAFVILQQIILLDFAFTWNEKWVTMDDDPYSDDTKPYLVGLIISSALLFAGSISALGVMFWQFAGDGCESNNAILSLTIILCFLATVFQLTINEEYSLLTSAVMTAYATYLAYSAVVLNPNTDCNPSLSSSYQTVSEAIGVGFTVLSITWATHTAVREMSPAEGSAGSYEAPDLKAILMKLCLVFALGSAFFGMVLTNWSTLQSNETIANPRTGYASMWIQASAQWIALILYCWALIAPKLFPDRDFGGK